MVSITAGVTLLRWPLTSALLMFIASSLKIKLRKADYAVLGAVCSLLGMAASCWFAMSLLGITSADIAATAVNIKNVTMDVISHTPPEMMVPMY